MINIRRYSDFPIRFNSEYLYLQNVGKALQFWKPTIVNDHYFDTVVRTIRAGMVMLLASAILYISGAKNLAALALTISVVPMLKLIDKMSGMMSGSLLCTCVASFFTFQITSDMEKISWLSQFSFLSKIYTVSIVLFSISTALLGKSLIEIIIQMQAQTKINNIICDEILAGRPLFMDTIEYMVHGPLDTSIDTIDYKIRRSATKWVKAFRAKGIDVAPILNKVSAQEFVDECWMSLNPRDVRLGSRWADSVIFFNKMRRAIS